MNKDELRRALRERRRIFVGGAPDRAVLEQTVAGRILDHLGDARIVAAYIAVGDEVDPSPALSAMQARGLSTALPELAGRFSNMRFLRWLPGQPLIAGAFGIPQPAADAPEVEPDLILAPLVGFDRAMRRLGQGAGFYDRAFARLPEARRIGLAWSAQEADRLPADEWDVPLHAVATEQEWIEPDT
jgi:5-formyltetrahydrofolate cyclo-ligase